MILVWPFQTLAVIARVAPELLASFIWVLGLDVLLAWIMISAVRFWQAVKS